VTERNNEQATVRGKVSRITFQDPQGRFTVARLELEGSPSVTVVGELFPLSVGEEIKVSGLWRVHPRYGLQLQAERWEKVEPATLEGIERYLGSGLIKGIGPMYARRLVAAFGLETLRVLAEQPHRLLEVPGIGRVRAHRILDTWHQHNEMRETLLFLQGHGVSSSLALKIYRALGPRTASRVRENPYCLAREVHGVGFLLADRIAASLGLAGNSPLRLEAGLLHALGQFGDEGHCFAPAEILHRRAETLLGVGGDEVQRAADRLAGEGRLIIEGAPGRGFRVYLSELFHAESRVAAAFRTLLKSPSSRHLPDALTFLSTIASQLDLWLEAEQRDALRQALTQKVLVITGGPGTGKTTLLTALLQLLKRANVSFALAAPTGRAAKRMEEATGEEGKTIHRLLEYNPRERRFQRDEDRPLSVGIVIVDEASMIDLPLMDHLLRAINPGSHLVLIGDVDQLPSVGPGCVLRDLIESGAVPVAVLRRIFRQTAESLIVTNAHRILQGQSLALEPAGATPDFVFIPCDDEAEILTAIKTWVRQQSLSTPQGESGGGLQVLSPMHRGLLGTAHLNRELQDLLNHNGPALERGSSPFRLGDKVIQLRNNYEKAVFNGDLGRISRIDPEEQEVTIQFYERTVAYGFDELDEIALAYAISIHKSQGSEYPAVLIPLHTSHYPMLHRSILYTAVTRAKERVALVGSKKALAIAIRNVRVERRFTGLREKLRASKA
jgi:exodeoxyribonuclease V alpha subunit